MDSVKRRLNKVSGNWNTKTYGLHHIAYFIKNKTKAKCNYGNKQYSNQNSYGQKYLKLIIYNKRCKTPTTMYSKNLTIITSVIWRVKTP